MKNQDQQKVWFITGASKGLGLAFVQQLLEKGYFVAATSRNLQELKNAASTNSENFLAIEMDLTDEQSVSEAIGKTITRFGRIDTIVNNAGYGQLGALEELSDAEARRNFEVNVFGSLNVIRQATPYLRKQGSGHIFNVSSIGGFTGAFPGFGVYCATKFAVAGFSESLAEEVRSFGINVTVVLPGYFRTSFLTSGSLSTAENPMAEYEVVRNMEDVHKNQINTNQPGDPKKGAAAVINIAETHNPPLYLFLGSDSIQLAHTKIDFLKNEVEKWNEISVSTDF